MTTAKAFESLTDYKYTVLRLKQPDLIKYVQKRQNTTKGLKQLFNLHHDGRIPHYDTWTAKRCKEKEIKTDKFFTEELELKYFASFFKHFNEFLKAIYSEQQKCNVWKTEQEWNASGYKVNTESSCKILIDIWWRWAEIADYLTFTKKNIVAIYNENQVTKTSF